MAVAMVAMLAFGGTYAYFTATAAEATGSLTTAIIQLTNSNEDKKLTFSITEKLLPYESVDTTLLLTNGSTRDSYAFITLDYTKPTGTEYSFTLSKVYNGETELTAIEEGVYGIKLTPGTNWNVKATFVFDSDAEYVDGSGKPAAMGATLTVTINAGSIQDLSETTGEAFADAAAAYAVYKTL